MGVGESCRFVVRIIYLASYNKSTYISEKIKPINPAILCDFLVMSMPTINEFGLIRSQKPAVKKLTLEAECDSSISYPQLERVIKKLRKNFGKEADCKITHREGVHVVLTQSESPVQKTMFEEYITG